MFARLFKVLVVSLVTVFSVCALAVLLSGAATLFGGRSPSSGGISAVAGGVSISFLKLIAVSLIILVVGLFGLTRLRRFLR